MNEGRSKVEVAELNVNGWSELKVSFTDVCSFVCEGTVDEENAGVRERYGFMRVCVVCEVDLTMRELYVFVIYLLMSECSLSVN